MSKKPVAVKKHEALRTRLREAGLRVTSARVAVLEQLEKSTRPLSHAELAERLAEHGFDQATVYRNLMDLTDAELATRAELGDHVWRFEKRRHNAKHGEAHPHFVCVDCGEVTCLGENDFRLTPSPGSKGSVVGTLTEVLLKGHCGRCSTS